MGVGGLDQSPSPQLQGGSREKGFGIYLGISKEVKRLGERDRHKSNLGKDERQQKRGGNYRDQLTEREQTET